MYRGMQIPKGSLVSTFIVGRMIIFDTRSGHRSSGIYGLSIEIFQVKSHLNDN